MTRTRVKITRLQGPCRAPARARCGLLGARLRPCLTRFARGQEHQWDQNSNTQPSLICYVQAVTCEFIGRWNNLPECSTPARTLVDSSCERTALSRTLRVCTRTTSEELHPAAATTTARERVAVLGFCTAGSQPPFIQFKCLQLRPSAGGPRSTSGSTEKAVVR